MRTKHNAPSTQSPGKKITFFTTDLGGRALKVRVHLRQKEQGNFIWYLATKDSTKKGKWTRFILRLNEMEELGLLLLMLSKFCRKSRVMSHDALKEIEDFHKMWRSLIQ